MSARRLRGLLRYRAVGISCPRAASGASPWGFAPYYFMPARGFLRYFMSARRFRGFLRFRAVGILCPPRRFRGNSSGLGGLSRRPRTWVRPVFHAPWNGAANEPRARRGAWRRTEMPGAGGARGEGRGEDKRVAGALHVGCDHTSTKAPDPIRTPKLSVLGRE